MKARIFGIALILLLTLTGISFAQQDADETWFVKNVPLEKVHIHSLGYRADFFTNDLRLVAIYMPNAWFTDAAGSGEIVYSSHAAAPYMEVYYLNGEFNYVRLIVHRSLEHSSWDVLPNTPEMNGNFENAAEFPSVF